MQFRVNMKNDSGPSLPKVSDHANSKRRRKCRRIRQRKFLSNRSSNRRFRLIANFIMGESASNARGLYGTRRHQKNKEHRMLFPFKASQELSNSWHVDL